MEARAGGSAQEMIPHMEQHLEVRELFATEGGHQLPSRADPHRWRIRSAALWRALSNGLVFERRLAVADHERA